MATSLPTYTGGSTALVQPTGNPVTDSIIVGSKWGTGPAGTGAAVTFSFPAAVALFDTTAGVAGNYNPQEVTQGGYSAYLQGFKAFDAAAQAAGRGVLTAWANVANIQFTEVAATDVNAGVLRFAYAGPPGLGASTYGVSDFPKDIPGAGDTWINSAFLFPEGWAAGTQNYLTMLHEAGHAIGLKHPHDTGLNGNPGWPATPAVLEKIGDDTLVKYSTENLVMAYNDIPGIGAPVQAEFAPTTPMQIDIAAIQYLYGPNLAYNAGNTVYTYTSTARYNETLWDGGGTDTIRVDGSANALISLVPGTWSQLGLPITYSERNTTTLAIDKARPDLTDPRTVFIYDTVTIENAIGGGGNDKLIGNVVANRLQGGAGNDELDGAAGIDGAVFGAARSSATLARTEAGWSVSTPTDGTDSLANVERLFFSDAALALDTAAAGNAGQTAQILRGLFGSGFLQNPTFVGIGLSLFDQGVAYADIVGLAIGTSVFQELAGSTSNTDFVKLVYKNVIGAEAGPAELANFVGLLDAGTFTQASLGVLACQVSFNTESVELLGLAASGIEFLPFGG
jgi:serralysin